MAKYTASFTVDAANTKVCEVHIRRPANEFLATVYIYGTFGSGTVTLFVSPDGGTTKVALKDAISGTAISTATAAMFTVRLGAGNTNSDHPIIYATLSGSTNPSVSVSIFDNTWI